MSHPICSLFGNLVLATLIGTPAAHAVCTSPKNICKHIDDCLQRTSLPDNKNAERIREPAMARWCWPALRHAPVIWVERSNGTPGRAGAQTLSMWQLLR